MKKSFAEKLKSGKLSKNIDKKLAKTGADLFAKNGMTADGLGLITITETPSRKISADKLNSKHKKSKESTDSLSSSSLADSVSEASSVQEKSIFDRLSHI